MPTEREIQKVQRGVPTSTEAAPPAAGRAANRQRFLWVDLRVASAEASVCEELATAFQGIKVSEPPGIGEAITVHRPSFICFEFDQPDRRRLQALQATKLYFPPLPILMLTEAHSEALATWSFRSRVWDYLVKPVTFEELAWRARALYRLAETTRATGERHNLFPSQPVPFGERVGRSMPRTATAAASDYVRAHLDIGISLATAASLCHLSVSEFSRVFKREHGRTFCDFLLRSRVAKAWELLASPRVTVSEVAFAVGFNDLSYFTRIFRRYTGVSASEYRKASVQRVAETGSVFRPSGSEMPTSSLHPCL